MHHPALIDALRLRQRLADGEPIVLLDCGFDLADPSAGERAHAAGHLPGARYAHLDRDLAGPKTGHNGRHPLPGRQALASTLGRLGVSADSEVVCYDDQGGPYAARAWWLLRWAGHERVSVLDGGKAAWVQAGGTLEPGEEPVAALPPYPMATRAAMPMLDADAVATLAPMLTLLDARAPERFRGDTEALDPVAGHIPGALNRFFKLNLAADGRFKPAAELKREFETLLDGRGAVHQCGSGVTACHNLLAMAHAGLDAGALYPGSWSEWCADTARPVARGD
jgi:thiosulfate/3-mercaptopyruvate sulfurtransferase